MQLTKRNQIATNRVPVLAIAFEAAASVHAHDLFLKLDSYILEPNSKAVVRLMNGTFMKSDGTVARQRFQEVTLLGPGVSGPADQALS